MKHLCSSTLLFAFFAGSLATASITLPEASPQAMVMQRVGVTDLSVAYHRPAVNGREIWGALVPYGMNHLGFGTATESPWRAGANENTVFTTAHAIEIGEQTLPAGRYGMHMILREDGPVTVIFSSNTSSWGSYFYDPAEDALRVDVTWEEAPFTEQLTYAFDEVTDTGTTLALTWEKKRIPISITIDTPSYAVASMKDELRSDIGFDNRAWASAARYLLGQGLHLELALDWADNAINDPFAGLASFRNYQLKADILEKLDRPTEAAAVREQAMAVATVGELHNHGRRLLARGDVEGAVAIFAYNLEKSRGEWPTHYGMARGYSALGQYEKALEHLRQAALNVPEGDTVNPPMIAANIAKLERGEDIN